ncbi:MAG: YceI family protein, partial [Pedobacter sp.]
MKTILILLLAFTLTSLKIVDKTDFKNRSTKWLISENSSLIVNGSTNISKFSCTILRYPKTDTIQISLDKTNNILLSGTVNIEVKNFDCNNYMMTKELRKTLKENEFPYLHIKFISLKEITNITQKSNMKGVVEIEIAGVA